MHLVTSDESRSHHSPDCYVRLVRPLNTHPAIGYQRLLSMGQRQRMAMVHGDHPLSVTERKILIG